MYHEGECAVPGCGRPGRDYHGDGQEIICYEHYLYDQAVMRRSQTIQQVREGTLDIEITYDRQEKHYRLVAANGVELGHCRQRRQAEEARLALEAPEALELARRAADRYPVLAGRALQCRQGHQLSAISQGRRRTMSSNGDFKPRNFRIVRHVTKTSILVIEDCLRLDKLRVEIVSYQRGEGVRAAAEHYLDTDLARLLFSELARGRLAEPYQEFKGTVREGQPQSRVFRLYEAKAQNPIKIEIANGPGEVVGEGAIKPAGKPDVSLAVLLSRWDARRIALAVLAHLSAWAAATYYQRVADNTWQPPRETVVDPETGEIIS